MDGKMFKSVVYKGDELLGEVEIYPQRHLQQQEEEENKKIIDELVGREIRISQFSQASERCPPLAVLHTITSSGVCFKMESKNSFSTDSLLHLLHSSCIRENKTAVMTLGGEELHLVAMYSRNNEKQYPCFWGFSVAAGLYTYCLGLLNLRCLGIVFDLDETLIVANTMRSFEDRIEALQRKIHTEIDPQRVTGILAEIKRYQDDKSILKQYAENDQVVENGRVVKVQSEVVPALSDNHQPMIRPLIRLQDKNIILTRINPQIRDTSVLVRLRPAWEDLRSYLTARGRKRFEVYVCTMAERDYALEMWRLLDPDSNLINLKELLDRIVCVKSGSRKSLFNVFQNGLCHPKMALVIDDRLKVWDEKDQPRVHVVPAFAPYYAPQAEENNAIPVLCVARNVACNVRGGFFKEFDEGLLQRIHEIAYEDGVKDIPSSPDVSNYLVSEDDSSVSNGNRDSLSFDGIADAEVERRMKDALLATSTVSPVVTHPDPRLAPPLQHALQSLSVSVSLPAAQAPIVPFSTLPFPQAAPLVKPLSHIGHPEPSLQSSPAREEGEVPESELDPDTRRRLLILQHGQDTRDHTPSEPPFPARPSIQVSVPHTQPRGSWFPAEEEMSPQQVNRAVPKQFALVSETMHIEKHRSRRSPFFPKVDNSIPSGRILHENQRLPYQGLSKDDRLRSNHTLSNHSLSGEETPMDHSSSSNRYLEFETRRAISGAETPAGVLQDIAMKCGTKVEFKPGLVASKELHFSVEAWFAGEKVGEGIGRTRREAQHQAAEGSIRNLANIYISRVKPDTGFPNGDVSRFPFVGDNGFSGNVSSYGNQFLPKEESASFSTASEPSRLADPRLEGSRKSTGAVSALKELCMMEGLGVAFQAQSPSSANMQNNEVHAQVEIDGQVLGMGIGSTWEEAKMQAADKALGSLRSMLGQYSQKSQGSPRSLQGMPSKRLKPEFPRVLQRMPSARYPKNATAIP
ncbi:C-terminal domain phosphatase-like 1 isoform 1 [Tripterygium wilfordii]|uniref:protein-serine/threonine phosphatase n=1 Tax=Tripterygium wilfordii TaxID=458696 RepID=A0A7J7C3E1_TRIWF|nr:RNA polymerase II C-terminal domain phosphatase-like 1 [Tripterygium wilfordii]KAF5728664.1 C-terminal domain phosphatase-like 1 isoform 1 [Tripterygium wilfordii]